MEPCPPAPHRNSPASPARWGECRGVRQRILLQIGIHGECPVNLGGNDPERTWYLGVQCFQPARWGIQEAESRDSTARRDREGRIGLSGPRIGVASVFQETNTFSPRLTDLEDFTVLTGEDELAALRGTHTEVSGAIAELERLGAQPVPLMAAWALPSGVVTEATFARLCEMLDDSLRRAGKLDGLVLALHGSMVSATHLDADSALDRGPPAAG